MQQTTDNVLAFNDAVARKHPDLTRLRRLLADVGLALEARLAIEDRLINAGRVLVTERKQPHDAVFAARA